MSDVLRPMIRASAFLRAEIFETLRQPRLILTLILGPFLILLLFGIGYRNVARSLRTLFVATPGSAVAKEIEQIAPNLGPQLIFSGTTADPARALDSLRRGEVDVVAVAPEQTNRAVGTNQQAAFTLYYDEIDPLQSDYIKYFGQLYIDEVNRRVLTQAIQQGTDGMQVQVDPKVLVSPFRVETKDIAKVQPTLTQFYAPAVLALLLQHLAITFAALSIVRERRLGTMELFRVSPLASGETLIGKYLSYLILGGLLAGVLSLLLVYGLHTPMLGQWGILALTLAALLFASLGIGFVISLTSQTESQAVQFAMIVLLATILFSGFFLRLETLWEPVRVVSWSLPATYGTILLQDVMLRGAFNHPILLVGMTAMGTLLFLVSLLLLRREMAQR